ncbi:MAG TPA: tRNA (adenosine(37)-N6)-threonylcarbamoyltransferase complex transferase subunit TsaD [Erysipelotrichaceae bacterium]|nr:tRNA (adenosine(37)-N6)-threonylcarbamoyltransferase complex transferase subunit TsaD [Erysipelotrichaceae bacterium]
MRICAIETSCDETAVAIIENGRTVLSNIVSSQINTHAAFGGVIPEVASRIHIENISIVLDEAIKTANLTMKDIDAFAITQGPGLIGSLHVGLIAAKTLAWYYNKPLIPIHHITGHIYANQFVDELQYPMLALVVSGGHTELVLLKEEFKFEILGSTQDDAIGEAFDKVARVMGLPYPGGPQIDRLAKEGKPNYKLPKIKTQNPLDFSFSGLKSSVLQLIQRNKEELIVADLAYAFQEAAINEIMNKTLIALEQNSIKHFVLAGGVAANSRLRERVLELNTYYPELKITIPPMWCCTDNAAMIGAVAYVAYQHGVAGDLSISANPGLDYA